MTQEHLIDTSKNEGLHSGFVTLIGRPNAGKSTLINIAVGEKVAITSSTPQTTRHRLRAILDRPNMQMVLVDTPGIHKPHDALGEELNHSAAKALEEVDVIAFLIDATKPVGKGDVWVANQVKNLHAAKILVISKADLSNEHDTELQIARAKRLMDYDDVVVVSALKRFNVEGFVSSVARFLPEGPRWFPEGVGTDQPLEVIIAEFIREKVLRKTHDEVPYSVGVQVEEFTYDEKRDFYHIWAVIYTERDSQKGIIIGKGGSLIKAIGTEARVDLAKLLGGEVYLDLTVKVKKDWRRDAAQIKRFGYGESR
jgi:GTPase